MDDPLSKSVPCKAQHINELRAAIGPGTVWNVRGVNAGPMLWSQTVPGVSSGLNGVLRATHVDDLRRWFNISETGAGNYPFPHVRPMIFGMNPSWREWQQNPPPGYTNDAMFAAMREAGATCIRSGIDWQSIQPNGHGTPYVWDTYDTRISLAQKYGLLWVADVSTAPTGPPATPREACRP
jgi:hypothetical protein